MAYYYLKLHHDTLYDPKMGMLSDHLYRRAIEVFLMASEMPDRDGYLPPLEVMAWKLHVSKDDLEYDLMELELQTGIVEKQPDGRWYVKNFTKRQAANDPTAAERMRRLRERNEIVTDSEDVTRNVTRNEDEKLRVELRVKSLELREEEKKKENNPASTATAINSFMDIDARRCEQVYQKITKQTTIPGNQYNEATENLKHIISFYSDEEKLIEDGLKHFIAWCNTRGKNGRFYSVLNTAWIEKWYGAIAPKPDAPQAKQSEYTGALCATGANLKRKAEDFGDRDHESYVLKFREHADSCKICGGKTVEPAAMPEAVKAKMQELMKGKVINDGAK